MEPVLHTPRLKKKSQSVDIGSQSFPARLIPSLSLNRSSPPVAKTTTSEVQENNTTNSQRRGPQCSDLKRGYTIDTGQKKTPEKKDGRRMSFQRPKGTIEYSVDSRDTLNSIALKFDTTPNELVQLNKLFSRNVVPGQVLYVPDPDYVSSVGSSPSFSPSSPLSPTSSEADLEKVSRDSNGPPRSDASAPPVFSALRPSRVVSSTSEEEEALTEKFLKINCKYITDGKGVVSGVLLVTPNNIMFDPHRTDPLVLERGCEEYGIMCPLDEVQSAAVYREITDSKIRDSIPPDFEAVFSGSSHQTDQRLREGYDSASTAPRSTEGSISEDVFTESELSPIREERQSTEELQQEDKSSGASSQSMQTLLQEPQTAEGSHTEEEEKKPEEGEPASKTAQPKQPSQEQPSTPTSRDHQQPPHCQTEGVAPSSGSQSLAPGAGEASGQESSPDGAKLTRDGTRDSETDVEELRKMWKSHTMQQAKEQRESVQQAQRENDQQSKSSQTLSSAEGLMVFKERQKSHKFLCLRVGKAMKKTFVSNASASMQQYAQRDRKHEYWFAVPQERSDHLYVFFIQWSSDVFGDGVGSISRDPGFIVVKKIEESEANEEQQTVENSDKEWEVVSWTEYHRRIDALNSEDLRSLCKRLQITTKEDVNSKHGTSITASLEPETFKPNLNEPSDLLEAEQIEKLAKHLPPRTIGYHWNLAFSTSKHGMSIKTLYRAMQDQDSPMLLVIKDSDGQIFGALASEPFKVSEGFYGTGETFLFTFYPVFEAYKWTGDNLFFIKGDMDSLAFGGGSGEFGLWLDGDLYHGRSHSCKTFGNPMLSTKEDFFVQDIEIWSFE
ncbi:oxidation resistance protein 1-like isoform X1 [Sinocyclocheilus rhinocerous]|uniref:oxidation resistance protein 1-like isoform X1 n=1 Tax=Sinocyclocheilus rhinocerous TaxID=307959 RepID=UPI0007B8AE61|nr:PREDICTED: oxidation resistance protein 1-like isoform X1 [Sinocyclocheilus rhinocerous]XP_016375648.1 PREDICTED: oxidation resistance protein 1-like isoform X1 [Sinocyclocheilus rhinocerous]